MTIETRRDDIACWPTREACIDQNRRVLARLLKHHGNIPPERGCSAEAIEIRRRLLSGSAAPLIEQARAAGCRTLEDIIAFTADRHGSSDVAMTEARGGAAAMRARREAIHLAHRLLGLSFVDIGRAFCRDSATIAQTLRSFEAQLPS